MNALKSEVLASISNGVTKVEVFQMESTKEKKVCKEFVRSALFGFFFLLKVTFSKHCKEQIDVTSKRKLREQDKEGTR